MEKGVSIVLVDKKPYRKIAQEHWGLSNEQMKGMHVHHRIPRSKGGTNDPTNLYVCSPWFHAHVWHTEQFWIETQLKAAHMGGKVAHLEKDPNTGRSLTWEKSLGNSIKNNLNEEGKWIPGVKAAERIHKERTKDGKSKRAADLNKVVHAEKDSLGRSLHTVNTLLKWTEENPDKLGTGGKKTNKEKDEFGRSKHAIETIGKKQKSIKVTSPNGESAVFPSMNLAFKSTGVNRAWLRKLATKELEQWHGWCAEFVNP